MTRLEELKKLKWEVVPGNSYRVEAIDHDGEVGDSGQVHIVQFGTPDGDALAAAFVAFMNGDQ